MSRCPNFIVIGAMKAATSTLHEQLARQPGLCLSRPKEPNFFSNDDVYSRGIGWYRALFAQAADDAICGESSTHYTKLPDYPRTVDRMQRHLDPRTRFVYIMRHPIERMVSQYIHEWTQGMISCGIDEAVTTHPQLVAYSRYGMQLEPYVKAFGASSLLLVFFERLRTQPQIEFERICRFIGYTSEVAWSTDIPPQNVSEQRMRKNALRDTLLQVPGLRLVRRSLVPRSVRNRIKEYWQIRERPLLSEPNVHRLVALFDQDLDRLRELFGIEVTCDSFGERCCGSQPVIEATAGHVRHSQG